MLSPDHRFLFYELVCLQFKQYHSYFDGIMFIKTFIDMSFFPVDIELSYKIVKLYRFILLLIETWALVIDK